MCSISCAENLALKEAAWKSSFQIARFTMKIQETQSVWCVRMDFTYMNKRKHAFFMK